MERRNIHLGENVNVTPGVSLNNITTGNNGKIRDHSILFGSDEKQMSIGDNFFIGAFCYINGCAGLTIGDNFTAAPGCMIFSDSGPNTSPLLQNDFPITAAPITIGNDVWLGAGTKILPGVSIGDHCVIGANSVVDCDIPSHTVAAGTPVKIIRSLV
jgi:acetyltransferase-like isoleucine patch superfamily enzyme